MAARSSLCVGCSALVPGEAPSPRTIGSVGVHLVRLHLQLERGLPHDEANDAMLEISSRAREGFVWLDPPASLGGVTVLDVLDAGSAGEHMERVRVWAASVWEAWAPHHETVGGHSPAVAGQPKIASGR